jgi:hypothetical protein
MIIGHAISEPFDDLQNFTPKPFGNHRRVMPSTVFPHIMKERGNGLDLVPAMLDH